MKTKIIILMAALLLVLPSLYAGTDTVPVDDVFQVNKNINYAKPCFNNGSYCSASAVCNYTIIKQDNTILLNNIKGTNQLAYHNITFSVDNLGIYTVNQVCCDNSVCGSETFKFEVTGSGYNSTFGFYVLILAVTIFIIVLGFWIKDGWIVQFGAIGLLFVGLYTLLNGIDFIRNLAFTRSFSLIIIGVAAYLSIAAVKEMIDI